MDQNADHEGAIKLIRGSGWQDFVRSYEIFIDDESVGRLKRNSELTVAVNPGTHTIRATISGTGSPGIEVLVDSAIPTSLLVLPGTGGSAMDRAASTNDYLRIELVPQNRQMDRR
jgi:hypothetical protein